MADVYCACGRVMSACDGSRIGCEAAQARYRAGAKAMRERAAAPVKELAAALATYQQHFLARVFVVALIEKLEAQVLALPLDADAGEDDAPNLCPGCYAFPGEPHPPYCPDAAIEREREESEVDGYDADADEESDR